MGDNACRHTRAVALFIQRQDCDFKDVFLSVEFADGSDRSVAAYRAACFQRAYNLLSFFS